MPRPTRRMSSATSVPMPIVSATQTAANTSVRAATAQKSVSDRTVP